MIDQAYKTRITGTLTFENEVTGEVIERSVMMKAMSDWTWVEIVDEACLRFGPNQGQWSNTDENLNEEEG